MRDLVLWLLFPAAFIFALTSAGGSVLVLNWIWFQRPYDFSWGFWNSFPMFDVAVALCVISNVTRGQLRLKCPPILFVYLLLVVWINISTFFGPNPAHSFEFYKIFLPSMTVAPVLMFATIHDLQLLKKVLWVAAGGIGINAFKVGLSLTAKGGGHVTDQIDGFVGDNNVFGLVVCLVVAVLLGLRGTLPKRPYVSTVYYTAMVFILLCVIYTQSRGALLTVGVILVLGSLLSGKPVRRLVLLAMVVAIGYWLIPHQQFSRLETLNDIGADKSATGRLQNWGLAWEEALENPLLGVGPDNHVSYNRAKQTQLTPDQRVQVRAEHSVYFQTLGELGFPALALYLLFVSMGLAILVSTWRWSVPVARQHPELAWVADLSFWMMCGYTGYLFGSALLNMLYIEFPWYVVFYGSMLRPLTQLELAKLKARGAVPVQEIRKAADHAYPQRRPSPAVRASVRTSRAPVYPPPRK